MAHYLDKKTFGNQKIVNGLSYPWEASDIGYILPYKEFSDIWGDEVRIARVRGSRYFRWMIFKDQLDFAFSRMSQHEGFRYELTIKVGTAALVDTLAIYFMDEKLFESCEEYMTLYPKALDPFMKSIDEARTAAFIEMLDILVP